MDSLPTCFTKRIHPGRLNSERDKLSGVIMFIVDSSTAQERYHLVIQDGTERRLAGADPKGPAR